jgi:DNA-binding CsgD family transcriptional regulator
MPTSADEQVQLSERERDILRLVATGAGNKEIAKKLFISPNTVKVHMRNIFAKIGVVSRTEATLFAIRSGLVTGNIQPALEALTSATNQVIAIPEASNPPPQKKTGPKWRRWAIGGFGVLLALLLALAVWVQAGIAPSQPSTLIPSGADATAQRWHELAALPLARKGLAAANYENQVYAIAGESPSGVTGQVDRFDPAKGTWQSLASKPLPVADVQAAVIGEKIYVPGGRLASGAMSDILEVYDPRRDEWSQKASLPQALSAYALVSLEGDLYLFGGWNGQGALDTAYIYDPVEDTWRALSPMPAPKAFAGAAAKGAKIFVLGGWDGSIYFPDREIPGEIPWVDAPPLPEGRYAGGVVEIGNQIYLVGGDPQNSKPLGLAYTIQDERWNYLDAAPLPVGIHLGIVAYEDYLITLGGESGGQIQNSQQICQVIYKVLMPIIKQGE